jgi:hypothetical protein
MASTVCSWRLVSSAASMSNNAMLYPSFPEVAFIRHSAEACVLEQFSDYLRGGVISRIVITGGRFRKRAVYARPNHFLPLFRFRFAIVEGVIRGSSGTVYFPCLVRTGSLNVLEVGLSLG